MIKYCPETILTRRLTSVCNSSLKFFVLTITIVFSLVLVSCEENPLTFGTEILPASDFVNINSDTINVHAFTVFDDSVKSDEPTYSFLGTLADPFFGVTTTEFVTQLRLGSKWSATSYVIDSVKMNLTFLDVQGSVAGPLYLRMSEIAEQLYLDSTYYSNKQVPLVVSPLYSLPDILIDSLKADTVNSIQVDLPVEFGKYLTRDTAMLFHDNTKPDFRSFFKGLDFKLISSGDPTFLTLSLEPPEYLGGYSNIISIYMHDDAGAVMSYYFVLDAKSNNARYNVFKHDFNAVAPENKIKHINDGIEDSLTYVQGNNGLYARLELPGLKEIKDDPAMANIAVNKARLTLPIFTDANHSGSKLPSQLYARYKTTSGTRYYVHDYDVNNPDFFDGKIDTTANVCHMNLASFVQAYLEDKTDHIKPEIEIFVSPGETRNIILKTNNSSTPVKFDFTYTKF